MRRIVVLIPGIMGSRLWHDDGAGGQIELWSEDFEKVYAGLVNAKVPLAWSGKQANAEVLKRITFWYWPWPIMELWDATASFLTAHKEFGQPDRQLWFGYDWRQSLLNTADDLAKVLTARAGDSVSEPPPLGSDVRFVIIAHSMGGVLVRVAVGQKKLHPAWLDRLFTVGSPLQGAPKALHTLYGDISPIPMLVKLIRVFHPINGQQFLDALRSCLQSFPSAYQLLPHVGWNYIYRGPNHATNALDEGEIPDKRKEDARQAHEATRIGGKTLVQAGTEWFSIYTWSHASERTEMLYRVRSANPGYVIERVLDETDLGDGTVPSQSATDGQTAQPPILPVTAVIHHKMCNESSVVDHLRIHLN